MSGILELSTLKVANHSFNAVTVNGISEIQVTKPNSGTVILTNEETNSSFTISTLGSESITSNNSRVIVKGNDVILYLNFIVDVTTITSNTMNVVLNPVAISSEAYKVGTINIEDVNDASVQTNLGHTYIDSTGGNFTIKSYLFSLSEFTSGLYIRSYITYKKS
tara:strand:- start:497 stop:988 length:492 start_codon:yes stop_codon:yes gene_type:complete